MDTLSIVLAYINNEHPDVHIGRTLLQKKIYFLNELIQGPIRYIPYFYGPYSFEVAQTVGNLVSSGIIEEKMESFPTNETPWGESTRYTYSVNDKNISVINEFILQTISEEDYNNLKKMLSLINLKNESKEYKALSIAAKVYQILKNKGRLNISGFPAEAKKLKWELNDSDVKKAVQFLKEIELLSIKA